MFALYKTQLKEGTFWVGYFLFCGFPIVGNLISTGMLRVDWIVISLAVYWCVFPIAVALLKSSFKR